MVAPYNFNFSLLFFKSFVVFLEIMFRIFDNIVPNRALKEEQKQKARKIVIPKKSVRKTQAEASQKSQSKQKSQKTERSESKKKVESQDQ